MNINEKDLEKTVENIIEEWLIKAPLLDESQFFFMLNSSDDDSDGDFWSSRKKYFRNTFTKQNMYQLIDCKRSVPSSLKNKRIRKRSARNKTLKKNSKFSNGNFQAKSTTSKTNLSKPSEDYNKISKSLNNETQNETTNSNDSDEANCSLTEDYQKTKLFISSYKEHINKLHHPVQRLDFWNNVSENMKQHGFEMTPKLCFKKWQNLISKYKQCLDSGNSNDFIFFKNVDEIVKFKSSNNKAKRSKYTGEDHSSINKQELMERMVDMQERKLFIYNKQCSLIEKYFKLKGIEREEKV